MYHCPVCFNHLEVDGDTLRCTTCTVSLPDTAKSHAELLTTRDLLRLSFLKFERSQGQYSEQEGVRDAAE